MASWSKVPLFVTGVIKYWGALVTGGVFIGALSIWQGTGHAVRPWAYWVVAFVALFVAFFKAWNDAINTGEAALGQVAKLQNTARNDALMQEQIGTLTQLADQGQDFIRRCRTEKDVVPHRDVENWAGEAESAVEGIFDVTYVSRFRSGVGVPMGAAHWPNIENRHVDGFASVRVYRLQGFIDELRAKLDH